MNGAVRWIFCLTVLVLAFGYTQELTAQSTKQETELRKVEDQKEGSSERTAQTGSEKLYWIFLNTGKSTEGVDPDEVKKMQKEHLANFKRLAEEEKLLTAGPMTDPEKMLRGIVIVKASDQASLGKMFKPDPFVQKGYLKIEATRMKLEFGDLNARITPQGLEEYRLVVIERNNEEANVSEGKAEVSNQQVSAAEIISKLSQDSDVLLAVSLEASDSNKNKSAVLILSKPEDEKSTASKMKDFPEFKTGQFRSRVFPLYMGKGTLKPRVPAS